ncbi:unnamed protein product [[Candida] boidinii]|uniref:Unnamed protein product n=1 Tax=Candida boidinii TaxID=5477 RepID=A0A9W6WEE1_CANBO|nr:hypothetical protein B5S30_g2016 [[Candida] boidinii]GME66918.1 unnamed protein product [[Candida] boidinii]GMG00318.1 unnamed protein product [[Candida] boidinii]
MIKHTRALALKHPYLLVNSTRRFNSSIPKPNSTPLPPPPHPQQQHQKSQQEQSQLQSRLSSTIQKSEVDVTRLVKNYDPSSILLSQFYPNEFYRLLFLTIKAFNIELTKLSMTNLMTSGKSEKIIDLKFEFWFDQISRCFKYDNIIKSNNNKTPEKKLMNFGEPISTLINYCLNNNIYIDESLLTQMIHSHKHFFHNERSKNFRNIESMCTFGEGTFSQMIYSYQAMLLSPIDDSNNFTKDLLQSSNPKTAELRNLINDIGAHIGQSTSIAYFLKTLKYYAVYNNQVMLPMDVLAKNNISQEDILRLFNNNLDKNEKINEIRENLKNSVFEIATVANDHIITSRTKFEKVKTLVKEISENDTDNNLQNNFRKLSKGIPDAIYLPYMNTIPTTLFLEKLEKNDFDLLNKKMDAKEWKLPFRSYWNYNFRKL